jgi:hypothetical protein
MKPVNINIETKQINTATGKGIFSRFSLGNHVPGSANEMSSMLTRLIILENDFLFELAFINIKYHKTWYL